MNREALSGIANQVADDIRRETGVNVSVYLEAGKGRLVESEDGKFWQIPIKMKLTNAETGEEIPC